MGHYLVAVFQSPNSCKSIEELLAPYCIYSDCDLGEKFDFYVVGGRYSNRILLKDGTYTNSADINDVDIDAYKKITYNNALRFWQLYIDGQEPRSEEERKMIQQPGYYGKEDYKKRYANAEEYASEVSGFTFCVALLPGGEWVEPCNMVPWRGSEVSASLRKEWRKTTSDILQKAKDGNWTVTMVDCHL